MLVRSLSALCLMVLLCLSAGAVVSRALAQPPDATNAEASATAKQRYRAGVAAYAQHHYSEAIALFMQADELQPSAALSYNIARAYEGSSDPANAVVWYSDYLRRADHPKDQKRVERRVEQLKKKIPGPRLQTLRVNSEPGGAHLFVDGKALGVTPWSGELELGAHQVVLRRDGYDDAQRNVVLGADQALAVEMSLSPHRMAVIAPVPLPAPAPALPTPAPPPTAAAAVKPEPAEPAVAPAADETAETRAEPEAPAPSSTLPADNYGDEHIVSHSSPLPTLGIVAMSGAALALGGALAFELMRRSAENDAQHEQVQVDYKRDLDRMQSRQLVARVLVGTGAALAVTAAVLWIAAPSASHPADDGVALSCLPSQCGVLAHGRF